MTRKHYIAIAAAFALIADDETRRICAAVFASFAVEDNPRFDRARFYEACGL